MSSISVRYDNKNVSSLWTCWYSFVIYWNAIVIDQDYNNILLENQFYEMSSEEHQMYNICFFVLCFFTRWYNNWTAYFRSSHDAMPKFICIAKWYFFCWRKRLNGFMIILIQFRFYHSMIFFQNELDNRKHHQKWIPIPFFDLFMVWRKLVDRSDYILLETHQDDNNIIFSNYLLEITKYHKHNDNVF